MLGVAGLPARTRQAGDCLKRITADGCPHRFCGPPEQLAYPLAQLIYVFLLVPLVRGHRQRRRGGQ